MTDVDKFQVRAWFDFIVASTKESSATELGRIFQTDNSTRLWDKYKHAKHVPSCSNDENQGRGYAFAVAKILPDTLWLLRHPIWPVMSGKKNSPREFLEMLEGFSGSAQDYYLPFHAMRPMDPFEFLEEIIGKEIWIERGDWFGALDHLAANLMMMNFGTAQFNRFARAGIAYNISKTLGPLSQSPWFAKFYEEFFDYLEKKIWTNLFDSFYHESFKDGLGWRKTQKHWLI